MLLMSTLDHSCVNSFISDQDCSEFLSKNKLKKKKSKIRNKLYKCKKKLSEFYKTNWELS